MVMSKPGIARDAALLFDARGAGFLASILYFVSNTVYRMLSTHHENSQLPLQKKLSWCRYRLAPYKGFVESRARCFKHPYNHLYLSVRKPRATIHTDQPVRTCSHANKPKYKLTARI